VRYLVVIVGLLLLVGGLVLVKFSQISSLMAMGEEMQQAGPPPESVATALAESQAWEGTISAVGSVAAVKGVALSNDAPGVVTRINFESGSVVKQGQVLVELDTGVERAQLATARTRRDLAEVTVNRSRSLVAKNVLAQAELDNDEAALKTAAAEIAGIQAQIARKTVRAPFSGRLGIREINVGQYLAPGTTLTVLESTGGVFVDFSLPQQHLETVRPGMPVRMTLEGARKLSREGVITAVEPRLDAATRALQLRASVSSEGDDDELRPGMFVNVSVVLPERGTVVVVPATAIVHASYGDSLFVIEDKKPGSPGMSKTPAGKPVKIARQQFVRLGESRGDFVSILEGVKAGQQVVTAGAFKLRNGSPVVVDNSLKMEPKLDPRPENR
jgi:membrane fusion protein (multidrug efflux system)